MSQQIQTQRLDRGSMAVPDRAISPPEFLQRPVMFEPEELLESLNRVIATFPESVVERGINRNWCHFLFLLKELAPFWRQLPEAAQVCDIGAGAAVVPLVLAHLGFRVNLIDQWSEYERGFDNQMGTADDFYARFRQFGANFHSCDLLTERVPLADESQDLVSAFAVLEHLPRPRILLDEMWRLLKPGGFAVVTVPNGANLRNRIGLLLGQSPHPDHWEIFYSHTFFGHYREPTARELREIFEHVGYEIQVFRTSNSSQTNTIRANGKWSRGWKPTSFRQLIRGLYLLVVAVRPSLRYDLLVVGRKPMNDGVRKFC